MPKILQWLSALPNPLAKHSNLSSHSMSKYDGEGALQFCAGCRLFKGLGSDPIRHLHHTHVYSSSSTLDSYAQAHVENSKLKYKKGNAIDQCVLG